MLTKQKEEQHPTMNLKMRQINPMIYCQNSVCLCGKKCSVMEIYEDSLFGKLKNGEISVFEIIYQSHYRRIFHFSFFISVSA